MAIDTAIDTGSVLAAYPDPVAATRAVAARHRRPGDEVLLTAAFATSLHQVLSEAMT